MTSGLDQVLVSTAQVLAGLLDGVFADLKDLAAQASPLLSGSGGAFQLEQLKPLVEQILAKEAGLVDGAGLATAPGSLKDHDTWLQWWRLNGDAIVFTPHNLNPASLNYYDYTEMIWFQRPVLSGKAEITGPYIDFGGTDTKVITASLPVDHGPDLRSVAGADLSMDYLERRFLRSLGARGERIALVTESGKIIASNDSRMVAGTRTGTENPPASSVPVQCLALQRPPWQVAVW
jgi:hypothetical protein